jgi:hypothetical protein
MDVVNAISCVFLFIAAGPFLEKLFLTSPAPELFFGDPTKKNQPKNVAN